MTNYTELKRLAEAAKLELADIANVVIEDGDLSHHELFQSLASPDVVLGLIKSLEHTTMAAEAEAKAVDERDAVIAGLRTQNQALMEALERMVESVTGVDQVSAVDEARAALTAAKQAQPPAPGEAAREYMTGYSDCKEWAQTSQAVELSDGEVMRCISESACYGTVRMSFESGPYSIDKPSLNATKFARAIIAAIKQGGQQ